MFSIEDLAGSNSYACSHCQRNTRAQKCLRLEKLPKILIVQLKRFSYERNESHKINHFLRYPLDLDLKPFIMLDAKDAEAYNTDQYYPCYRLASFIVHLGETVDSGHYITFLRSRHNPNQWYKMDDLRVQEVSLEDAMSQLPYILCYEQVERDHPSPLLHVRWDNNHQQQPSSPRPATPSYCSNHHLATSSNYHSPISNRSLTFSSLMRGKSGFGFGSSPDYRQQQQTEEVVERLVIDLSANDSNSNGKKHVATIQSPPSTYLKQPLQAYDDYNCGSGLYEEISTFDFEDQHNPFLYTVLEGMLASLVKGLITLTWWQLRGLRDLIFILVAKARDSLTAGISSMINGGSTSHSQEQTEDSSNNGHQQQQPKKEVKAATKRLSLLSQLSSFIDGLLVTAFQRRSVTIKAARKQEDGNGGHIAGNGQAMKRRRGKPIWE